MSTQAVALLAQADAILLAAAALRRPAPGALPDAAGAGELARAAGFHGADAWAELVVRARAALEPLAPADLAEEQGTLFDGPLLCPIHETAYVRRDKGAILADIAGFYRAFGFGLRADTGEKGDHLVAELEFLAVLLGMAAGAHAEGRLEQAETCHAALRAFAADHLGEWLPSFCVRLLAVGGPAARAGAELLRHTWAELCRAHGLEWIPALLEPQARDAEAEATLQCGGEAAFARA